MQIHIDRQGERFGPYSLDEVNQYLAAGNVLPTDLGWHDGMADWVPVTEIGGVEAGAGGTPPPPTPGGGEVASTCPQCAGPVEVGQVVCTGCGHHLQALPVKTKSNKGLVIGLAAGGGVLLVGIILFFVFGGGSGGADGAGAPDSAENLGRRIFAALKAEDFSKYETATVKVITKGQFESITREGVNVMRRNIEDKLGGNPMAQKMLDRFDEEMAQIDSEIEKAWTKSKSEIESNLKRMKTDFDATLVDAKGDGIDWGKAEFMEAKFERGKARMMGADDLVQEGDLTVVISVDGKEYDIEQRCINMKNVGWLSKRRGPRWGGEVK